LGEPGPAPEPAPSPPPEERANAPAAAPGTAGDVGAAAPGDPRQARGEEDLARWLEAIAYALLALAGLAALGLVLLWRATRALGRIAAALEGRPQR
jgi:hypothetical protein